MLSHTHTTTFDNDYGRAVVSVYTKATEMELDEQEIEKQYLQILSEKRTNSTVQIKLLLCYHTKYQ